MNATPKARQYFPAHVDGLPSIPAHWQDSSWKHDLCPSFQIGEADGLRVSIEHADPAQRAEESGDGGRFLVFELDNHGQIWSADAILETDEWERVLSYVERHEAALRMREGNMTAADIDAAMRENNAAPLPCPELHAHLLESKARLICEAQPGYGSGQYRGDPYDAVALKQEAERIRREIDEGRESITWHGLPVEAEAPLSVLGTFGLRCPRCERDDSLYADAVIPVHFHRDETGVADEAQCEEGQYDEDSRTTCSACHFTAPLHRFRPESKHNMAPQFAFDGMPAALRSLGFEPELGGGGAIFASIYLASGWHIWATGGDGPSADDDFSDMPSDASGFTFGCYPPDHDGEDYFQICSEDLPGMTLERAARAALAYCGASVR